MLVVGTPTTLTLKLAAPTPLLNHRLYREEEKYACGWNTHNFGTMLAFYFHCRRKKTKQKLSNTIAIWKRNKK